MSLLLYKLSPEGAVVMTDTAVADDQTGELVGFSFKADVFPDAGLVMTTLGSSLLARMWAVHAQEGAVFRDVDGLAMLSTEILSSNAARLDHEVPLTVGYLFGWSEAVERCVGYVFRSVDGFEMLPLEDGIGVHPILDERAEGQRPSEVGLVGAAPLLRSESDGWSRLTIGPDGRALTTPDGDLIVNRQPTDDLDELLEVCRLRQLLQEAAVAAGDTVIRVGGHLTVTTVDRTDIAIRRHDLFPDRARMWGELMESGDRADRHQLLADLLGLTR